MKKLLMIVLALLLLTACGKQEAVPAETAAPVTEGAAVPETLPETLPPETTQAAEATEPLPPPPLELTDKGKEFLTQMCFCLNGWGRDVDMTIDWHEAEWFLRDCVKNARKLSKTKVMTIAGEAQRKDGEVLIPWKMAEELVKLTFGLKMPIQEYWETELLKDGVFHIPFDNEGWGYAYCLLREWAVMGTEADGREWGQVVFDYYLDDPGVPTGNATFTIAAANNENGFVIQEMKIEISPEAEAAQEEAKQYALEFARKVIAGDEEAIQAEMLPFGQRYDESYEEGIARLADSLGWELEGREGQPEAAEIIEAHAWSSHLNPFRQTPLVDVWFYLDGETRDQTAMLVIALAQTEDGYKVREYGFTY